MNNSRTNALRYAAALGVLGIVLALPPASEASVRVNFDVNLALPPNVHVEATNYQPYYVGRIYYEPRQVWRPVYAFPVETAHGVVVYQPYIYDGTRVVFHDYIPGHEVGYGEFVREGHGHYDPSWHHDHGRRHGHHDRDGNHGHDERGYRR